MRRDQEWLDDAIAAFDLLYFEGALALIPTRAKWHRFSAKNGFTYGDYLEGRIRINSVLASEEIPSYVVLATVFHECLHAVVGMEHDLAFELAEARYVHYTKAMLWEAEHYDRLIARVGTSSTGVALRRGRPPKPRLCAGDDAHGLAPTDRAHRVAPTLPPMPRRRGAL